MNPKPEPTVIHDGTVIIEANDEFCDLFRCGHAELVNLKMEQIISSEELQILAVWRGKHIMAQPEDKEFRQEYDFLRCDGSRFWGESTSRRIEQGKYKTVIKWEYDIDR